VSSQTLEDMISSLLVEEKRTIAEETKGHSQLEMALYLRYDHSRSTKDKGEMECYYCKKMDHTTWNCRFQDNDIFQGKFKVKPHVVNVAMLKFH
jgi:hypothetical protein